MERSSQGLPLVGITGPRISAAEVRSMPYIFFHTWVDSHYVAYPKSVAAAGGLPVHLPREGDPEGLVDRLDGLLIAGGQDVDPRAYGQQPEPTSSRLDPGRDAFELALIEAALESGVRLLGICRGAQLMNVARGGTLVSDLAPIQGVDHALVVYPPEALVHSVSCQPGTLTHAICGDELPVNSFHHQSIANLGAGVAVSARAEDDTIEAIEIEGCQALGVQWHPEWISNGQALFDWLVNGLPEDALGLGEGDPLEAVRR